MSFGAMNKAFFLDSAVKFLQQGVFMGREIRCGCTPGAPVESEQRLNVGSRDAMTESDRERERESRATSSFHVSPHLIACAFSFYLVL